MRSIEDLLENNRYWSRQHEARDPGYFERLSVQQKPYYLWIGCSDSRVPANEIIGMHPGELFVHRNIANLVFHTDMNCLSVLQYAVDVLEIKEVIICGHYGCGGVKAAMEGRTFGLIDNWISIIRYLYQRDQEELEALDEQARWDRMCELNVINQVERLAATNTVQQAWKRGQQLTIHGWVYQIKNGLVKDLKVSISSSKQVPYVFRLEKD
ncbi:MAG: carbonate dehydratase [bacterium]